MDDLFYYTGVAMVCLVGLRVLAWCVRKLHAWVTSLLQTEDQRLERAHARQLAAEDSADERMRLRRDQLRMQQETSGAVEDTPSLRSLGEYQQIEFGPDDVETEVQVNDDGTDDPPLTIYKITGAQPNFEDPASDGCNVWINTALTPPTIYNLLKVEQDGEPVQWIWAPANSSTTWKIGTVQLDTIISFRVFQYPGAMEMIEAAFRNQDWDAMPEEMRDRIMQVSPEVREIIFSMTGIAVHPGARRELEGHSAMASGDIQRSIDLD